MDGANNPNGIFAYVPFEGEEFVEENGERFVYRGGHLLKIAEVDPHWVRCRYSEDGMHEWHSSGQCSRCACPLQFVRGEGGSEADFQIKIQGLEERLERQRLSIVDLREQKDVLVKENEAKERMLETRDRIIKSLDAEYQTLRRERDDLKRRNTEAFDALSRLEPG